MVDLMETFFFDQTSTLPNDAYRIGRRSTRSSSRDEEALGEELEALEAHLSFAEHHRRAIISEALGDRPPVTLESFFEESTVIPGEYQLFVTSEIHNIFEPAPAALGDPSKKQVTFVGHVDESVSEPSSPATGTSVSSAASLYRAASAAAASPSSVVGPRRRKSVKTVPSSSSSPAALQRTRSSTKQHHQDQQQQQQQQQLRESSSDLGTFDTICVISDGDDSFDATFDEINIELTQVSPSDRYVTVYTSVSPGSPIDQTTSRPSVSTPSSKRKTSSQSSTPVGKRGGNTTPGKRGRKTTTTTTTTTTTSTVTVYETNYLENKPSRSGSYAGEEVLRISSVIIEETDVDILN